MMRYCRGRALAVTLLFSIGFTVISCRLIYLQLISHEKYKQMAVDMHYGVKKIPARRGNIMDRQGKVLAQTVGVTDLRIDGLLVSQNPSMLAEVAYIIGQTPTSLTASINPKNRFLLVAKELTETQVKRLKAMNYRPLIFDERTKRVYPGINQACHVLGFTNFMRKPGNADDGSEREVGVSGIERAMERYLAGETGERRIVKDGRRVPKEIAAYRKLDRPARNGMNVVLTIDQVVQYIAEEEADRLVQEYAPKNLHITIAKPDTGEILAMCSRPAYDPNDRKNMNMGNMRNAAIMDVYEPGSTFKIITLAAAMSEHVADLDTKIFCENGEFHYGGKLLKDSHRFATIPVRDALAKSSNIAFAKLGLALGQNRFYRYIRNLGFGNKTQTFGMALNGEENGILTPPNYWSKLSLTRIPIGYEVAVTNLQMTMAFCALANKGRLMEPRLIKAVVDDSGRMIQQYPSRLVRQAVPEWVGDKVLEGLRYVVHSGTGQMAATKDYVIGGKTGTARKVVDGVYSTENYISSFIGYVGASSPEFIISIVVDEPQGGAYYGSQVAAPAFRNIAIQVAEHLNLPRGSVQKLVARRTD